MHSAKLGHLCLSKFIGLPTNLQGKDVEGEEKLKQNKSTHNLVRIVLRELLFPSRR